MNEIIKTTRTEIDALLEVLTGYQESREYYKGYDCLQTGFMRLGKVLGMLGAANPYPESTNIKSAAIEPPADKASAILELPEGDEIVRVKFFRERIDHHISNLLTHFNAYWKECSTGIPHEALVAIDALQDSKMWFGQVLNNIRNREIANKKYQEQREENINVQVREAYIRYGSVTDFKNFKGDPMPEFDQLPVNIQKAWREAVCPNYVEHWGMDIKSKRTAENNGRL